jgi:hypothetical protein
MLGLFLLKKFIYTSINFSAIIMTKRKITAPKASQIRSILYQFEKVDMSSFDFVDFLKNIDVQDKFFNNEKLSIDEILFYVWSARYDERDLIKKGELEENNSFFKRIVKIINANPAFKQEMLEFCTLMYFEDNSICSHWNFKSKLSKENFDQLIFKSIYQDARCFKLFLKNLTNEEFSNIKFKSPKHPDKPALDFKTKVIKDILYGYGATRTGYKKLLKLINDNLNVTPDYNALFEHLDKDAILYYPLQLLDAPEFNQAIITHKFNGVELTTTVENLAKYNSMHKGLTECMQKDYGFGLDGKVYKFENFEDLIYNFAQEPFLRKALPDYCKEKASKAVKKENKTTWSYFANLFEIGDKGFEEPKQKKVNKI